VVDRLVTFIVVASVGLVAVTAAGPTLVRLVCALTPLILVVGIVAAVLRTVWYLTRGR
jgi:hypothetical protein